MRKLRKIGAFVLSVCLLFVLFSGEALAASAKVSVSSTTGNVGSTVTVTCTATASGTAIGGADITLKYDPASLSVVSCSSGASGSAGSIYYSDCALTGGLSKLSFTVNFKILKAGAHSVSVTSAEVYEYEAVAAIATSSSGGTVTGKVPTSNSGNTATNEKPQNNKDTNNKLSALQVYPGTLDPIFHADTSSYTVNVSGDTTQVTISATPASSKATVSVSGGKDLKLGPNEAKVIVVAESGASRAYAITIMCGELEKIQIDGVEHTIDENFSDEQIPTGFQRKKVTYNDRQYEALTNANESLVLVNLKAGEDTSFYIYDQNEKEFYDFVQIKLSDDKYIVPLPLNKEVKEFSGCELAKLQIQGKDVEVWKLDEEFSVAYVMNQNGENMLYRYDSVDGTFQRYVDVDIEQVQQTEQPSVQKTWFPSEYYMYAIIGLGALSFILLIAMIYFIASRKTRHEGRKKKVAKRQEKQKNKEERQREKEKELLEEQRRILEEEREKQRKKEEKRLAKKRKIEE